MHVLYVCPCICTWWWRLLCRNEWGASSSVIHPPAKSLKKLHAPHSSPLLTQTVGLKWSGLCCLCLCESLCTYACSSVGWMGWSGLYNSREPQRALKETVAVQIKWPFSGPLQCFCTAQPIYYIHRLLCCWPFSIARYCHVAVKAVAQWWDSRREGSFKSMCCITMQQLSIIYKSKSRYCSQYDGLHSNVSSIF